MAASDRLRMVCAMRFQILHYWCVYIGTVGFTTELGPDGNFGVFLLNSVDDDFDALAGLVWLDGIHTLDVLEILIFMITLDIMRLFDFLIILIVSVLWRFRYFELL